MAALQGIRNKAGLLIGTLGLALLAFILSDFLSSGNTFFEKAKDKAFTVDGNTVTTGEYTRRISDWELFEESMSQQTIDESRTLQIRELVYEQMVKEMMLDEQAAVLGLAVTKEELNDMVYGQNISPVLYRIPFFVSPQTGQFDIASVISFLTENNLDPETLHSPEAQNMQTIRKQIWSFIENMMKYQRLEEKYSSLVASTVFVNDSEAKASFDRSKSIADIAYVVERYSSIADSTVSVSDAEIKTLYDRRKGNYKLDSELRKISYFVKDIIPNEEDYITVAKQMEAAHEKLIAAENPTSVVAEYTGDQYIDAFIATSTLPEDAKLFLASASVGQVSEPARNNQSYIMYKLMGRTVAPDSIQIQFMPIPQGIDPTVTATVVDSLYNVIRGGKSFATVVNEMAPGEDVEGVWANELMLANAGILKECVNASAGDVLKLIMGGQTQLIRIAQKTRPVSKVKLAVVQIPVVLSDKTLSLIDNELNQFIVEGGNIENFNKLAQSKGYGLIPDAIIAPSDTHLGQTPGTRSVVHWAFNEKVGSIKKFDESSDRRIIAIIKDEIKGSHMPMNEIKDALRAELIKDKKAEMMIANLKAKNLTSLDAYAESMHNKVDTAKFVTFETSNIYNGPGYEPIFNIYSKVGQINKLEGPMQGESGVYVLNVVDKIAETKEYNPTMIKQALRQGNLYQLITQSTMVLQEKMKVEDNRIAFW